MKYRWIDNFLLFLVAAWIIFCIITVPASTDKMISIYQVPDNEREWLRQYVHDTRCAAYTLNDTLLIPVDCYTDFKIDRR